MVKFACAVGAFITVIFSVVYHFRSVRRANTMLQFWAIKNGFRLESFIAEKRSFLTGPFWWRKSGKQVNFRIFCRDPGGRAMSGWARVGDYWLGLDSDEITVVWDEPDRPIGAPGFPVVTRDEEPKL